MYSNVTRSDIFKLAHTVILGKRNIKVVVWQFDILIYHYWAKICKIWPRWYCLSYLSFHLRLYLTSVVSVFKWHCVYDTHKNICLCGLTLAESLGYRFFIILDYRCPVPFWKNMWENMVGHAAGLNINPFRIKCKFYGCLFDFLKLWGFYDTVTWSVGMSVI